MAPRRATEPAHHSVLYERLLWLYPASFRREYGHDMVQVFCDRLHDELRRRRRAASARVWLHTLRDLAVSVPKQQVEAFMFQQQTTPLQIAGVAVIGLLAVAAASLVGPFAVIPFLAVAGWLHYQERRAQIVRPRRSTWQRWVMRGIGLLAITWLPAVAWLAISEWAWGGMMVLTFVAMIIVVIGVAMGLRDRPRDPVKPA
jgi:hypothetical protein